MKYIQIYENFNKVGIPDVAWLFFLHYLYNGKMKYNSWYKDERMGVSCEASLNKFNTVSIEGGYFVSSEKSADIIDKYFGAENLKSVLILGKSLEKYDIKGYYGYSISDIPYDLYMKKNPKLKLNFEKINSRIISHFNSMTCSTHILEKLSKSKNIKEFNFVQFFKAFPDLPKQIKVYRGIKNEYMKRTEGYSCWTYSKKQAERFASYNFTGGMQLDPSYADNPHILESEINIDDIAVFIGNIQGESEIILKNPVPNIEISKIEINKLKK